MIKTHEGLEVGVILSRPHHVAEAYVREGLAEYLPLDAPAPAVAPPPGPGARVSSSDKPKPKRKRKAKAKPKAD
jgi:hypothetical protein